MGTHESNERFEITAVRLARDRFVLSLDGLDEDEVRIAADTVRPWVKVRIEGLTIVHSHERRAIECTEVALLLLQAHLDAAGAGIIVQVP